jgi:hypothetical protein
MKDDIFQKISRFYYGTTAEWNVLIFWYVAVLLLQYIKKALPKYKKNKSKMDKHIIFENIYMKN